MARKALRIPHEQASGNCCWKVAGGDVNPKEIARTRSLSLKLSIDRVSKAFSLGIGGLSNFDSTTI